MNQVKKKLYKQRHKQEIANVKQLLLSDDPSNNTIGLMLAVTQLKWGSERIARIILQRCYLTGQSYVKFNDIKLIRKCKMNLKNPDINDDYWKIILVGWYTNADAMSTFYNFDDFKFTLMDYIEGLIKRNKL